MPLFKKRYLDNEDKSELRLRQQQINMQRLCVQGLEELKRNWMIGKFTKYGLDANKQWTMNALTGKISEVKNLKKEVKKK